MTLRALVEKRIQSSFAALKSGEIKFSAGDLVRYVRLRRKFLPEPSQAGLVRWVDGWHSADELGK